MKASHVPSILDAHGEYVPFEVHVADLYSERFALHETD